MIAIYIKFRIYEDFQSFAQIRFLKWGNFNNRQIELGLASLYFVIHVNRH